MDLTVYRLNFHSGFHIGIRGVNLEESGTHIPSDTIFAALVDAVARIGVDPERFVAPFPRHIPSGPPEALSSPGGGSDPPFLLTSAFPFVGAVRFFPMPVPLDRWFQPSTLKERSKDLKRVRFVSEALFRRMLDGEQMDDWLFPENPQEEPEKGVALQGETFWLTRDECKGLPEHMRRDPQTGRPISPRALRRHAAYRVTIVPRVTVDRVSSASEIYHTGRVSLSPACGLWLGILWKKPDATVTDGLTYHAVVRQALALLGDDGLGGERSVGYGAFSLEGGDAEKLSLPDPAAGKPLWLLSRYHPRPEEVGALTAPSAAYNLVSVGGWLRTWDGAAQRRQRLWLLAEGSVICPDGNGPWGDLTDVRPRYTNPAGDLPHPVWRYGVAIGAVLK